MVTYREFAPHPALRPWVHCYWFLTRTGPACAPPEPILPDGCCEVVFNRGQLGARFEPLTEQFVAEPRALFVGEVEEQVHLRSSGDTDTVAIRLAPGGMRRFFSATPHELIGRSYDLSLLWADSDSILEQLAGLSEPRAVVDLLDRVLLACPSPWSAREDSRIDTLLGQLQQSGGRISIGAMASRAGISTRHLERLITPAIGLPPKRLARVLRFHDAFAALLAGDLDRALRGYYDQSHLLRDFREFAAASPSALLQRRLDLNRAFATRRGAARDEMDEATVAS